MYVFIDSEYMHDGGFWTGLQKYSYYDDWEWGDGIFEYLEYDRWDNNQPDADTEAYDFHAALTPESWLLREFTLDESIWLTYICEK